MTATSQTWEWEFKHSPAAMWPLLADTARFNELASHAYRPKEIFAEDFRVLFGGDAAYFGGFVENTEIANPEAVKPVQSKTIELSAEEPELLLFDWLSELLYVFESEKLLLGQFDVKIAGQRLSAVCRGEPMDYGRHEMDHEVKAITYHGLKVERQGVEWLAEVIVDI